MEETENMRMYKQLRAKCVILAQEIHSKQWQYDELKSCAMELWVNFPAEAKIQINME